MIFTSLFKRDKAAADQHEATSARNQKEAERRHKLVEHAQQEVMHDEMKLQRAKDQQEDDRWEQLNERLRLLEVTLAEIVAQGSENAKHNVSRNGFRNH